MNVNLSFGIADNRTVYLFMCLLYIFERRYLYEYVFNASNQGSFCIAIGSDAGETPDC
jgi:hypothetical protein